MQGTKGLMLAAVAGLGLHSSVGGWAVITIANPPDYLEAGSTYRLEYMVRQHGRDPLGGLQGSVQVQPVGASGFSVSSSPGTRKGSYYATLKVPGTDQLSLKVSSGFSGGGWGDLSVSSIPIVQPGQARPAITLEERGRRLFVAKGCGTCHLNGDVPEFAQENRVVQGAAPELTGRRLEGAYVRQRLTDPASLPQIGNGQVRMPNLELASNEVEALVAMLSGPAERAGR